jgi:hypothetical protein
MGVLTAAGDHTEKGYLPGSKEIGDGDDLADRCWAIILATGAFAPTSGNRT